MLSNDTRCLSFYLIYYSPPPVTMSRFDIMFAVFQLAGIAPGFVLSCTSISIASMPVFSGLSARRYRC